MVVVHGHCSLPFMQRFCGGGMKSPSYDIYVEFVPKKQFTCWEVVGNLLGSCWEVQTLSPDNCNAIRSNYVSRNKILSDKYL